MLNLREDHNIPVRAGENLRSASLPYVLVTAAHNEELYIERTIKSVISQTVLPLRWVIVDDGSSDRTGEIVRSYLTGRPWIVLMTRPKHADRQLRAKAICFNEAYRTFLGLDYDVIGNIDADISFGPDHMAYILGKFPENPKLGVAGTPMKEEFLDPVRDGIFNDNDVFGACQFFRRECLLALNGYSPTRGGGMDWAACTLARMLGWETRSFMGRSFFHHRPMGQSGRTVFQARYDYGKKDYSFGNHPLWEFFRIIYQSTRKPILLGGLLILIGYLSAWLQSEKRIATCELLDYHRHEQLDRLKLALKSMVGKNAFPL